MVILDISLMALKRQEKIKSIIKQKPIHINFQLNIWYIN